MSGLKVARAGCADSRLYDNENKFEGILLKEVKVKTRHFCRKCQRKMAKMIIDNKNHLP
jgi:hypothetical protein